MSSFCPQGTRSGLSEGNTADLESLADIIAILRYKGVESQEVV